jgi:hypothetical protein
MSSAISPRSHFQWIVRSNGQFLIDYELGGFAIRWCARKLITTKLSAIVEM